MNGKGKDVSRSVVPEKRKEPKPDAVHEKVDILKQKKPKLKDMLLDENFEKLDEKHVKSITLHRLNDGDRLWTHLNTALHINNKEKADKTKYETKDKNYQILRNDSLFDGDERAEEYFKHDNCRGKTYSRFCSPCAFLAHNEAFNKVNRCMQILIAQIVCLLLLKEGQEIPQIISNQFNHNSDAIWLKMNYQ
ncbi:9954_t:CDS:2 [Funneliformis geosporum]|nr:9954_t:CDS:2 [Funneliformis geosporum]